MGCANISAKDAVADLSQAPAQLADDGTENYAWPKLRCTKSRPHLFVICEEEPRQEESAANSRLPASPHGQGLLVSIPSPAGASFSATA